jgi:succinate dehydrogenase flavin-adding protein (antitoxin of CptAB toxin-antitoxin module)
MKFKFLQNLLGLPMSPKKRAVRKIVQKFYRHAIKSASNDSQRKLWIAAILAAEELVMALLAPDSKGNKLLFNQRIQKKKIEKKQIRAVLHAYLSAILIGITNYKKDILTKTGMNEQDFLKSWCSVFEYDQEDMKLFDTIFLPIYHQNGLNGLLQETGKIIVRYFYQETSELTAEEIKQFEGVLLTDISGLFNYLNKSSE